MIEPFVTPELTPTQSSIIGVPSVPTRFLTPAPYRVSPSPELTPASTGTMTRRDILELTLVVVQPTHYYNATLTQAAANNLETWQAQPTFTLTPTPTRDYIWLNGCCWGYWDGQGWVLMPTPVATP